MSDADISAVGMKEINCEDPPSRSSDRRISFEQDGSREEERNEIFLSGSTKLI